VTTFGFAVDLAADLNPNIGRSDALKPATDILGGPGVFSGKGEPRRRWRPRRSCLP
jgi:hypothetical protein